MEDLIVTRGLLVVLTRGALWVGRRVAIFVLLAIATSIAMILIRSLGVALALVLTLTRALLVFVIPFSSEELCADILIRTAICVFIIFTFILLLVFHFLPPVNSTCNNRLNATGCGSSFISPMQSTVGSFVQSSIFAWSLEGLIAMCLRSAVTGTLFRVMRTFEIQWSIGGGSRSREAQSIAGDLRKLEPGDHTLRLGCCQSMRLVSTWAV